jgi:stress-induced morphogen
MFKSELKNTLNNFPQTLSVNIDGEFQFIIQIVSKIFEGLDEADRQEMVYNFLRNTFKNDNNIYEKIEFIFTDAPSELKNN